MIDGQQPHLVEIHRLFHRLKEPEAEHSLAWFHALRGNFQVFVGIGNIALSRRDPMAHDTRPDHVGNEFIFMSVPGKQNGAGTPAPVQLRDGVLLLRHEIHFVLRNTRWPEQPHHFRVRFGAEARQDWRGILP